MYAIKVGNASKSSYLFSMGSMKTKSEFKAERFEIIP